MGIAKLAVNKQETIHLMPLEVTRRVRSRIEKNLWGWSRFHPMPQNV